MNGPVAQSKVAVLGPGAVGGMLAARTGAICVGTKRTVDAIRATGITLVHGGLTEVAHPVAVERLEQPVSLLVVAVKTYGLDEALERIETEAIAGALVLPLLNGLEHVEAIRTCNSLLRAPSAVVAAGSIGRVEVVSPEPGLVVQRTPGATITAASRDLDAAALGAALEPLHVDGIELVYGNDERAVLWDKAARLAVMAAATVASDLTFGVLRESAEWRARLEAALDEAVAVASAEGVVLDAAVQWAIIESLPADATTSTARDAAAGRPTELDAITGSVVRAGARLGVATPALEALLEEATCRVPSR